METAGKMQTSNFLYVFKCFLVLDKLCNYGRLLWPDYDVLRTLNVTIQTCDYTRGQFELTGANDNN